MTEHSTAALMRKAYARWAPIYDVIYDRMTAPAARATVEAAIACGSDILEAGVGTGLSLDYYPSHVHVVGTDLSEHMLREAQKKVCNRHLTHVKGLQVMDACRLGFKDHSFDAVVAQMLITLVPRPEKALDEFERVTRPGGEIIIVNHFGTANGPIARVEEWLDPIVSKIGWSAAFKIARIENWAKAKGNVSVVEIRSIFAGGFLKIVRLKKTL